MNRVLCLVVLICAVECLPMSQEELEDFSNFLLKTSQLDLQVKKGADAEYDENEIVSDHAWEDSGKFEGDLILNDRQRRLIVENVEGLSRNGLTDSTKKWPDNEVVYFIQREHFNSGQVQAIQDGIDDLAQASCVKFRPYRKGDRDAVVIQGSRPGCFSQVGYQGGYQVLNLSGRHPVGRGCFRHGTVVHELLHSLGFYHMQSSPDRDDYIDVVWANIVQPARHNFRKYNSFSVSDYGVGYDYDSVLHYSRKAFSANGQDTLVPKQRGAEIGQRAGLSDKDTQKLNRMYCDANNEQFQGDETATEKPKNKKKKPKNQPFEGHGIGYHQGKTLAIKLPVAQAFKLPNVPSTSVFDFSKTPQVVPTSEAEEYGIGKEITYSYTPITSLINRTPSGFKNQDEYKPSYIQEDHETAKENPDTSKDNEQGLLAAPNSDPDEVKPEYVPIDDYDKYLKESFDRLSKIVKQHIYPKKDYNTRINKDYSKFYSPIETKTSDKFEDLITYELPTKSQPNTQKLVYQSSDDAKEKLKDTETNDEIDSSYRTSLPIKKPYSYYTQTETPKYATLEYLKGRHDFSDIYSPKSSEDDRHRSPIYRDEPSSEGHEAYYKEDKPTSDEGFYSGNDEEYTKEALKNKEEKDLKLNSKLIDEVNRNIGDEMDSSYRTSFSTPKSTFSEYIIQTETPKYATLEYLQDRHNISMLYTPKTRQNEGRSEPYVILREDVPTEGDWYKNDAYKDNDAKYDKDYYTDSVHHDRNRQDNESNSDEKSKEVIAEENGHDQSSNTDHEEYKDRGDPDDGFYEYSSERREPSENLTKSEESQDYSVSYDEDDSRNRKEPKNKSTDYTLYGVPVPVTNDWFKQSYEIPHHESFSPEEE